MELREVLSSLAVGNGIACGPDLMRYMDGGHTHDTDRRKRPRLALTWTIYLLRSTDTRPLESKTKNVSSEGFYCCVRERFVVGECIRCTVFIPTRDVEHPDECIFLECQATVVRVDPIAPDHYGIGCHIESYKMVTRARRTVSLAAT